MKTLKIQSRHSTLAEAVESANFDLSYNEHLGRARIRDLEDEVTDSFVLEGGVVAFVFQARDGLKLFHEFDPFCSVLSNTPFAAVTIEGDEIQITDHVFPKSRAVREYFSEKGIIVT